MNKKALLLSDELAEIYEIMGRNLRNLNRFDEAMNSFLYAKSILKSASPSLNYEIGLIHFIKRDYPAARRLMETAVKMGYDTASLRIHLGKVYYQMGMLARAEDCFKRVLRAFPKEGSLYFLLGIVYKSSVEYHLAIEAFQNAIKYGSDQKEEHLGLAEIYTRMGYWKEAIQEYQRILEFENDNFIAHYFLGWIYEIQGWHDQAIQEYLLANKIDPNDEDTKQKLTNLLATPIAEEYI
jgi:tetratricopeptide (TPR) repeat protein